MSQVVRVLVVDDSAFVRKVVPDYFTTALTYRTVEVLEESAARPLGRGAGRPCP